MSDDDGLVESVCRDRFAQEGIVVQRVRSVEEGVVRLVLGDYAGVFVRLGGRLRRESVEDWIWDLACEGSQTPVVALVDVYDVTEAIGLFQIGVSDYLSVTDHIDKLALVAASLPSAEGGLPALESYAAPLLT